jgi:rubredoxin
MQIVGEFTCSRCRRVHAGITEAQARKYVADFNAHFEGLTPDERACYTLPQPKLDDYRCCRNCGAPNSGFVPVGSGAAPVDRTLQVVIVSPVEGVES